MSGPLPLAGRTVVVTRAPEQSSSLVAHLRRAGAEVVAVPTIALAEPVDGGALLRRSAAAVDAHDWVAFTSANAVARFAACLSPAGLGGVQVAAVGPATAAALTARGFEPDLVASRPHAGGLAAAFPPGPGSVLLPQAAGASDALAHGLSAKGWTVTAVEAYRTVPVAVSADQVAAAAASDAIAFTSGSTVAGFLDGAGPGAVPPVVACIGPVTAAAAEARGLAVTAVADEPTVAGLVAALVRALGTIGA